MQRSFQQGLNALTPDLTKYCQHAAVSVNEITHFCQVVWHIDY